MRQTDLPEKENSSSLFAIDEIVQALATVRQEWRTSQGRSNELGGRELPSREALSKIIVDLRAVLFPMRLGPPELRQESEDYFVGHTLDSVLHSLLTQVRLELLYYSRHTSKATVLPLHQRTANLTAISSNPAPIALHAIEQQAKQIVLDFSRALPEIRRLLDSDVLSAFQGDPAARSVDEVLLCYPGIHA